MEESNTSLDQQTKNVAENVNNSPEIVTAKMPKRGKRTFSDNFLEYTGKFFAKIEEWRVAIFISIAFLFLVVGIITLVQKYYKQLNAKGMQEVALVIEKAPSKNPSEEASKDTASEDYLSLSTKLSNIASSYDGLTSGILALFEKAEILSTNQKYDEAIKTYEDILSKKDLFDLFKFRAINGMANAYSLKKEYNKITSLFEKYSSAMTGFWKEQILLEIATSYEAEKNYQKAITIYEDFKKTYPLSPFSKIASSKLDYLKNINTAVTPNSPTNNVLENAPK